MGFVVWIVYAPSVGKGVPDSTYQAGRNMLLECRNVASLSNFRKLQEGSIRRIKRPTPNVANLGIGNPPDLVDPQQGRVLKSHVAGFGVASDSETHKHRVAVDLAVAPNKP